MSEELSDLLEPGEPELVEQILEVEPAQERGERVRVGVAPQQVDNGAELVGCGVFPIAADALGQERKDLMGAANG